MSEDRSSPDRSPRTSPDEDNAVARLLEHAGPRGDVPPEHLAAIETAFRSEWEALVASRRRRRQATARRTLLAVAASALVVAGLAAWWLLAPGSPAARVEELTGSIVLQRPGSEATGEVRIGQEVADGATIETGPARGRAPGRVALRLAGGPSLRLDHATRLQILSAEVVELERGAVYVDTGLPGSTALAVRTALGTARDVGTQFEVRLLAGAEARERLQVRVREGLVTVTPSEALRNGPDFRPALEVAAGAELVLHPDGHVEERPISSYDEEWQWILEVARFTAEDDTLAAILTWAGRETGWTIRYETDAVAATAARVRYRGAFADVSPDEVPEVVRGAGLAARLEDGVLIVHDPAPVVSGDDAEP